MGSLEVSIESIKPVQIVVLSLGMITEHVVGVFDSLAQPMQEE